MAPEPARKIAVRLTRSLVLVGLMGAGKTSVGKRLAAFLDVNFADSDQEIELAAGLEVREIFERYGEAHFREGEARVIQRLLDGPPRVLATGGGAFMAPSIRAAIAEAGVSVWLDADLPTLWARVKDKPTRPLLQQSQPRQVLAGLLETRRPTYALADVRVPSAGGVAHETMVRAILEGVRAYDLAHPDRPAALKKVVTCAKP
ncbi:MAG: shikimate kinase [Pseudomonadota bacterium]